MGRRLKRRSQYALIGYVVSKVGFPIAKRALKKRTREIAASKKVRGGAGVAAGAALGAAAWLITRAKSGSKPFDDDQFDA